MTKTVSKRDLAWGYTAQFLKVGLGLLMLPVVMHFMSPEEVGLWFVFVALASLALLMEFGFQPTLARNVAYIYAGAQRLTAVGFEESNGQALNTALLADVVTAARWIYRRIALLVAVTLWGGGSLYIASVLPVNKDLPYVFMGWFFFSAGSIFNFYYGYLNALLQGRGDITKANKVIVVSQLCLVAVGAILVASGVGLLGLGIASLLAAVVGRLMARHYVFSPQLPEMLHIGSSATKRRELVKVLWHNASRFGTVSLGVFLIWRANMLVASSTLGLVDAASYSLAIYVFSLLNNLSSVPFNLSLPKLNSLRAQGEQEKIFHAFGSLLVAALFMYAAGALAVVFFGNPILNFLGSATKLPHTLLLSCMAFIFLLEINHGLCANFITTSNHIPFVKPAVISGFCIVGGSIILAPILGMAGLVISQGVVQLLYNNWKWPLEVSRICHTTYVNVLTNGASSLHKRLL